MRKSNSTPKIPRIPKDLGFDADFDTYWKETLDMVQFAVAFFFPKLYPEVDWTQDYKPLEQELRNLRIQGKKGEKRIDKLFRLKLLDGAEHFIFLHFEAELEPDANFPKRVFEYFCKLIARYGLVKCTVLTLYVGDKPTSKFNSFTFDNHGTKVYLGFNTYVIAAQKEADLIASDNPIALFVLANLYVIQSKGNPVLRRELKEKFFDILAKKNISEDVIRKVVIFVEYFIRLKPNEEAPFWINVNKKHFKDPTMTAAVKKKLDASAKKIADNYCEIVYGASPEDLILAKNEANRNAVLNLYQKMGMTAEQISQTLVFDLVFVQATLDEFNKKA
jgi:Putative transposase, YhgA-like